MTKGLTGLLSKIKKTYKKIEFTDEHHIKFNKNKNDFVIYNLDDTDVYINRTASSLKVVVNDLKNQKELLSFDIEWKYKDEIAYYEHIMEMIDRRNELKRKQYIAERMKKRIIYNKDKVLIYNFITTGERKDDEILQLSIIDGNGKCRYNSFFKPKRKQFWMNYQKAKAISYDNVVNAPHLKDEVQIINRIMNEAELIVGYNISDFDSKFKNKYFELKPNQLVYDVMYKYDIRLKGSNRFKASEAYNTLYSCAEFYGYDFRTDPPFNALELANQTRYCFIHVSEYEINLID